MAANAAVNAVLCEGETPKQFFLRHLSAEKEKREKEEAEKRRREYRNSHNPGAAPVAEWPDREDHQDWLLQAVSELEQLEDTTFSVTQEDADEIRVESSDRQEYLIFQSHEEATRAAVARVKYDVENEPGIFFNGFLDSYINEDRLRHDLYSDTECGNRESFDDSYRTSEAKRDILIDKGHLDEPDFFDENGSELEITPDLERKIEHAVDDYTAEITDEQLKDPVQYLKDMFGNEEGVKTAVHIGGVDSQAAAEAAVDADGAATFLAHYDHEEIELPSGAYAYRT